MSDTLSDSPPTQLEPISAPRKHHKSRKPIATQAKILSLKAQGATNTEISEICETDRNTVARILSSADIQQHVEEIRSDVVLKGDLWLARGVMRKRLKMGSESAAATMLRGFNVFQANANIEVNLVALNASAYAQRQAAKAKEAADTLNIAIAAPQSDEPAK